MKKNLLLYILLGFLVLMNGFFLFNHFSTSDKSSPQRPGQVNFISKQLDFDTDQLQQFKALEQEHREKMRAILDAIKNSKDVLFDKLSDEKVDPSEIDGIATIIAEKEKAKDLETFRFFREVGEICNETQRERFNAIVKDAIHRQGPPRGRKGPPRGPGDEGRPPPPRN
ncbi:MAG: hypothetical protein ABJN95_10375 [Maribacter sp.]|uniref:Spy/CpxP family protein refolding chaperone n=1 Tax=Maribacter sp. TaxID=1897614 RepID=UPI003298433B